MSLIVMPKFGLTMTEGLITRWLRQPGEMVMKGEVLFEVETDKVTNEVEAADSGPLAEILQPEGSVVAVGEPIARLGGGADAATPVTAPADAGGMVRGQDGPAARVMMAEHGLERGDVAPTGRDGRILKEDVLRVIATPLARRIARQKDLDLRQVAGTGPGGRIKAADLAQARTPAPAVPSAPALAMAQLAAAPVPVAPDAARMATARRVQAAKRDIPHFYLTRSVQVAALDDLRGQLNASEGRVRITMTHLLVRATALALAAHPGMNSIWLPDGILPLASIGVGIVAETPQGLRIPVLDAADRMDIDTLAGSASALLTRAREGRLTTADVTGGAISISNVGMFGADSLTPIISPPQAMILGVGAEQRLFRPDDAGQPRLSREIVLTLAADHRLIDGAMAARFMASLARLVEQPLELLRAPARA